VEILSLAMKAREAGDYSRAAVLLNVAAGRENAEAQFRLGEMFVEGDVPTERFPQGELSYRMQRTGVRWLTAAAQAGHVRAEARLASIVLVDANTPEREATQARRVREEG
jgi:TPR repeat protein